VWFLKLRLSCKGYLILRDIFPEWLIDLGIMKKGVAYFFLGLLPDFNSNVQKWLQTT
jgi:hypothetical protein